MKQITYTRSRSFLQWTDPVPIGFTEWKSILSNLTTNKPLRLSSPSDSHRRSTSQVKKHERHLLPRNQVFGDAVVDSFIVSSSSIDVPRQDIPKILSPPIKRYVSSFKTIVNSTNSKQTQRLNYINDSVVILKLSKHHAADSVIANSQLSSKNSALSVTTAMSAKSQRPFSPPRLSPVLKVEGQKHRIVQHDSAIIIPTSIDIPIASHPTNQMAMSTSTQPQTSSSVFTYRSAAAGGNTVRQRAIAETAQNSLLISTERLKSNMPSSIRSTRQSLTTTTTALSSTYISSQQAQRNINQNMKSRVQQEKLNNSREIYDYPDPFTNCPQDVLNKLAQLTKLQLETIDWEKKKRFTKKKPITNGIVQVKDSP